MTYELAQAGRVGPNMYTRYAPPMQGFGCAWYDAPCKIAELARNAANAALAAGSGIVHGDLTPLAKLAMSPLSVVPGGSAISDGIIASANAAAKGDLAGAGAALGNAAWTATKAAAPYIQQGVAFVPGVGPEAAAAMAIGMTLAQGGTIDDALIAGARAAIPGGDLALAAFDTGVGVAQGQSLTDAAITSTGKNLVPQTPEAQAGYRAAIGIAKGQNIQQTLGKEGAQALMETVGPTASGLIKEAAGPLVKALAETGTASPEAISQVTSKLPVDLQNWFSAGMKDLGDGTLLATVSKNNGPTSPEANAVKLGIAAGRGAKARALVLLAIQAAPQIAPVNKDQVIKLQRQVMTARLLEDKTRLTRESYVLRHRVAAQEAQVADATKKKNTTTAVVLGVGLAGAATYVYLRKKKMPALTRHA